MRHTRTLANQNAAEQVTRRETEVKFLLNEYLNSLNTERSRDYRQPPGNQCIAKRTQYKYIC